MSDTNQNEDETEAEQTDDKHSSTGESPSASDRAGERGQPERDSHAGTGRDGQTDGDRPPRSGQPEDGGQQSSQGRQPVDDGQHGRGGRQPGGRTRGATNGHEQPAGGYQATAGTGLDSNVAAALSYLLGWVTGIVFLLIEKEDDFVRFHAAQSIVVTGALTVGYFVFFRLFIELLGAIGIYSVLWIGALIRLGGLVAVVVLMYMAYDGRWYRVPIAADIADDIISDQSRTVQPRQPRGQHSAGHQQAAGHQSTTGRPASRGQQSEQRTRAGEQPTNQQRSTQNQ